MRRYAEEYEENESRGWERWQLVLWLMSGLTMLFATAGAVNTLAGGKAGVRISGTRVDLPDDWEVVIPLFVIAALLFGLGWFLGNLYVLWARVKKHPVRSLALVGAVVAAVAATYVFWARYALEGGKLFWAIENDRMDIFEEAMGDEPDETVRIDAAYEAAEAGRVEMLRSLIKAGVPVVKGNEFSRCLLASSISGGLGVLRVVVESGLRVGDCGEGSGMLVRLLRHHERFGYTAPDLLQAVQLLISAGADPQWTRPKDPRWALSDEDKESAHDVAAKQRLVQVVAYFDSQRPEPRAKPAEDDGDDDVPEPW